MARVQRQISDDGVQLNTDNNTGLTTQLQVSTAQVILIYIKLYLIFIIKQLNFFFYNEKYFSSIYNNNNIII